ncbi:MAG TPA: hypothetical protein VEC19_12765 [Usitatibacter sp.]|nr:hypothetical protein [Usitatibacter sp.]
MSTNPWLRRLREAHDPETLAGIVNEYLASWSSEDLRELPVGCSPGHVGDVRDIRRWADHLSAVYCDAQAETSPQHRQMLAFFMAALERQAQILTRSTEGEKALKDLFSDDSRPRLFARKVERDQ